MINRKKKQLLETTGLSPVSDRPLFDGGIIILEKR